MYEWCICYESESVSDFLVAGLNRISFKIAFMLEVQWEEEAGAKTVMDVGSQAKWLYG